LEPGPEQIERDLAFAVLAAREAGRRLAGLRRLGRWQDEVLGDVADQAADGYIQGLLQGRYPDDGLLSEETADTPERLSKSRVWIVDPLDGTKEYRGLRDDWAVHVALTIDGRCALGAVALPEAGALLWGVALPGRERAGVEGAGTLVRGDAERDAPLRVAVSRSHTPPWVERFTRELDGEMRAWGSVGFKVGRLLLGEADVYVHRRGLKEWDTCAPETVARALGWSVCRLRGEEHRYNQRDPKNHELVVCRPAVLERVLAALGRAGALEEEARR
jgi:3'(2'), 5'-bisphosphate nucleotidase